MSYQTIFLESLAELKTRRGSPTLPTMAAIPGYSYPTDKAFTVFVWNEASTAVTNNVNTIGSSLGDTTTGRWLLVSSSVSQVNVDWLASSGLTQILNKPVFATVATSGLYSDLSNKPALFSGSYTDLTNKPSLFDGTYANLTGKPVLFSGAYSSLTGLPTLSAVSSSGSYADLLNKPTLFDGTYASLTGKPTLFSGIYSSLTGIPTFATVASSGSYVDLINKPTLFSGVYADLSGKPSLATVAGTGLFSDLLSKPTTLAGYGITDSVSTSALTTALTSYATTTALTTALTTGLATKADAFTSAYSYPTRALNTAFQISATREATVVYPVDISITSLLASTEGGVYLEYADNSAMTTNLVSIMSGSSAVGGVVNISNKGTVTLTGRIPAGKYVWIRSATIAGTPTFAARKGQEVII